jgi:predicted lactoylglutathione lyase
MAKTRFTDVHPILPVRDLRAAVAHYESLGFRARRYADGDDYGFIVRKGVELHLTHQPTSYYREGAIAVVYLDVEDADALYDEWLHANVGGQLLPPADMEWGMHEGTYTDPDGNVIRYGSPINS